MRMDSHEKVDNKSSIVYNKIGINSIMEGDERMPYERPVILAESTVRMAQCRPNSKPSGRPCNPPGPSGR